MPDVGSMNDVEAAKLAVTIEKIGYAFYTAAAQASDSRQVARMFRTLAQQEEVHRGRFEGLAASLIAQHRERWDIPTMEAYLRALFDTAIFPDVETAQALAQVLEAEEDALRLALKVEKDSVLFYSSAAGAARARDTAVTFAQIADEEKTHVVTIQSCLAKAIGKPAPA
jgi:rubrerythrin